MGVPDLAIPCWRAGEGEGIPGTQLSLFWPRLIIRNGNNVEAPPVYDSYEVEYLPIEGLLSSGRYFFVEFSTDSSGAAAGMALRYEGEPAGTLPVLGSLSHVLPLSNCSLSFLPHFAPAPCPSLWPKILNPSLQEPFASTIEFYPRE